MGWNDPDGLWARRLRRRIRKYILLGLLATGIGLALTSGSIWLFTQLPEEASGRWVVLVAVPLIYVLLPVALMAAFVRSLRRIGRLVPQHEGRLCPHCRRIMGTTATQPLECRACHVTFLPATLVRYWEQYVFSPRDAALLRWEHMATSNTGRRLRWAGAMQAIRISPLYSVLWVVGCFTFAGVGLSVFSSSHRTGMVQYIPMTVMMSGFVLVMHGVKRRVGESRYCAVCEYEQAPGRAVPPRCPECNAEWAQPGGTVHGRPVTRPGLIAAGVVLFLAGIALLVLVAML
jgi:hypothetical protein